MWAGLLHSLSALPPEAVLAVLELLQTKVLGADEGVAPRLRSEPFGDTALAQVLPPQCLACPLLWQQPLPACNMPACRACAVQRTQATRALS